MSIQNKNFHAKKPFKTIYGHNLKLKVLNKRQCHKSLVFKINLYIYITVIANIEPASLQCVIIDRLKLNNQFKNIIKKIRI